MSAAEETRLRHLLRHVTGALNEREKQYEESQRALYESREALKTAQAVADGLQWQVDELRDQNEQLREYASDLWQYIYVGTPRDGQRLNDRAHELGVKVGK